VEWERELPTDEEMNVLISRGAGEPELFAQIDAERDAMRERLWREQGGFGTFTRVRRTWVHFVGGGRGR
jgi:hypothetical protein